MKNANIFVDVDLTLIDTNRNMLAGATEALTKLNAALLKLSPSHRLVVVLHDVQGLSHDEIAKIMNCNVGTVRSRLFYARQQLQAWLSDYLKAT